MSERVDAKILALAMVRACEELYAIVPGEATRERLDRAYLELGKAVAGK